MLALVKAFLKAGVMTELGIREASFTGTPQGGILSPLLANIALSALDEHVHGPWRRGGTMSTPRRRALAEEGTRLADARLGVSDETWAQVREHYDDGQVAALIYLIGLINAGNRINVIVRTPAGWYEAGTFSSLTA